MVSERIAIRKLIHIAILPFLLTMSLFSKSFALWLSIVLIVLMLVYNQIPILDICIKVLKREEGLLLGPLFMIFTAIILILFPNKYSIAYAISALSIGDFIEIFLREKDKKHSPLITSVIVGIFAYILSQNVLFSVYSAITFLGNDLWAKISRVDDNILHFLTTLFLEKI